MHSLDNLKIAVIGLGYVGLPLAVEFGKTSPTVGFDINETRIDQLRSGWDATRELEADELGEARHLTLSSDLAKIAECNL